MMSRTYHLLVLPIFTGLLVGVMLAMTATVRLACMATATTATHFLF